MQGTAICRRWLGEGKGKSVILLLSYWNCSVFATVLLFPEDADKQQKKAFKRPAVSMFKKQPVETSANVDASV